MEELFYFETEINESLSSKLIDEDLVDEATPVSNCFLFDVSWEVCRKISGIYTVFNTKCETTVNEWGERYALLGPYSNDTYHEFEPDLSSKYSTFLETMKSKHKIVIYYGRWLIRSYPKVFLFDLTSSQDQLYHWKNELFNNSSVIDDKLVNDSIVFGYQVALFFSELVQLEEFPICINFHEWMTGVGVTCLNRMNVNVAKIFTCHATVLGSFLAASQVDLYRVIDSINPEVEANRLEIYHRHWIESTAVKNADVFTTVSEITAYEAEKLLGRKPKVITPSGLLVDKFVAFHEFQNLHLTNKEKINEFIRGHFCGSLNFEIDNTLYFFTSGRRDYRNKGVDLFIEALAELNNRLKMENSSVTIIAFIIMPGRVNNYNPKAIKYQSIRRDVRDVCDKLVVNFKRKLYESLIVGKIPDMTSLITHDDIVLMKRTVQAVSQNRGVPSFVTHNISGEKDEIVTHLLRCDLTNNKTDRVKVIYHPEFLGPDSMIFPIEYKDFVRGCHMGVFPSYYEPWGYTSAECTAMGVPSVSSDLSGFANYMSRYVTNIENYGINIIKRKDCSYEESKTQLTNVLWKFTQLSRQSRIQLRNKTEYISSILDWKKLAKHYSEARKIALKKVYNISTKTV